MNTPLYVLILQWSEVSEIRRREKLYFNLLSSWDKWINTKFSKKKKKYDLNFEKLDLLCFTQYVHTYNYANWKQLCVDEINLDYWRTLTCCRNDYIPKFRLIQSTYSTTGCNIKLLCTILLEHSPWLCKHACLLKTKFKGCKETSEQRCGGV